MQPTARLKRRAPKFSTAGRCDRTGTLKPAFARTAARVQAGPGSGSACRDSRRTGSDLTGYIGEGGRTALRLDASYELLFTQRLILEPTLEADVYGKSDPRRGIGRGFSDIDLQLRLRYEIRREFAPYVGVSWVRKFGRTRDIARADGGDASEVQVVAGLRFWF